MDDETLDLKRDHYRSRWKGRKRPIAPKTTKAMGLGEVHIGADYSDEELEILRAIDKFRSERQRSCPSYKEIFGVMRKLGYRKCKCDQCAGSNSS